VRIVENIQPAPPPPPRTFNLMEVTEWEMKLLRIAISRYTPVIQPMWDLYIKINTAIAD
jgi:hypothetical protein